MKDYHLLVPGPDVCAICGSWENLQVHHKNGNHDDDRPENLEWRCWPECHAKRGHGRYIPKPRYCESPRSQRFERQTKTDFSFKANFRY